LKSESFLITVCLGFCHSEIVDPTFEAKPELATNVLNRHSAAERLGEADEVMAWLCSDASRFVNGAAITVDGGTTTRLY
jgi:NAD(P)-dependent dehydrogenase (short-subunit alcohol dehydrogenase family)